MKIPTTVLQHRKATDRAAFGQGCKKSSFLEHCTGTRLKKKNNNLEDTEVRQEHSLI
jgi:hypothetical protein